MLECIISYMGPSLKTASLSHTPKTQPTNRISNPKKTTNTKIHRVTQPSPNILQEKRTYQIQSVWKSNKLDSCFSFVH